jgi:hypothetical protein
MGESTSLMSLFLFLRGLGSRERIVFPILLNIMDWMKGKNQDHFLNCTVHVGAV